MLILAATFFTFSIRLPNGWYKSGSSPQSYDMEVVKKKGANGKRVASIKSNTDNRNVTGTLMQKSEPGQYLGKRVRMTGYMKTEEARWAVLWFRVDQEGTEKRLAFDNMRDRPVQGTTDWTKYEIVLDVPRNASNVAYGALLGGTGRLWFDDINFEIVDSTVALTR